MTDKQEDRLDTMDENGPLLRRLWCYAKEELRRDFRHSDIVGLPFFVTRGIEVNCFFLIPSVSTLAILMFIFVPTHRYPTFFVLKISCLLLFLANIAALTALVIWRFLVERHYQDIIEKRRKSRRKGFLNSAARFASPFLTPDNAHPARHLLGLWVKDNLVYIFPSVAIVALFPLDIEMLDPVVETGISSILTYFVLFAVMANLLMLAAFGISIVGKWVFQVIVKITAILSGANYYGDRR